MNEQTKTNDTPIDGYLAVIRRFFRRIKRQWYKLFDYGEMLDNHRRNGHFRVEYPDGKISQKFSWRCAKDYQSIFGGTIIDAF